MSDIAPRPEAAALDVVYKELRARAGALMARERPNHTLQPTALVHEAWERLLDHGAIDPSDHGQYLAMASHVMRQILVDHARKHGAQKRGGEWQRLTLSIGEVGGGGHHWVEVWELHQVLERLAKIDARMAQAAELRFFGGLSQDEVAAVLKISRRTLVQDWRVARAWLARELAGGT